MTDTPTADRHCDDQQFHGPHDWWLDMRGLACPGTFPLDAATVMAAFSEALEVEWEQQSTRTPDFGRLAAVVINTMGGLGMAVLPTAELESVRAELAAANTRRDAAISDADGYGNAFVDMRADRDRLAATVDRSTAHVERLRELADGWVKNGQKRGIRHMISAGQILGERLDALSAPEEGSNDE